MATITESTLTIYKGCKILQDKNFIVDNLTNYLTGLTKTTVSHFQYVKHGLRISIKVNLDSQYLDGGIDFDTNYNYISIKNSNDNKTYYYFITKKTWLAQSTIQFDLEMDTLNTWNGNYELGSKTQIQRQHKNRFYKYFTYETVADDQYGNGDFNYDPETGDTVLHVVIERPDITGEVSHIVLDMEEQVESSSCVWDAENQAFIVDAKNPDEGVDRTQFYITFNKTVAVDNYVKKIDRIKEDLNPTLYRDEKRTIYDDSQDLTAGSNNWYLVYVKESASSKKVKTLLYNTDEFRFLSKSTGFQFNKADMEDNVIYFIDFATRDLPSPLTVEDEQRIVVTGHKDDKELKFWTGPQNMKDDWGLTFMVAIRKHENKIQVTKKRYNYIPIRSAWEWYDNDNWTTLDDDAIKIQSYVYYPYSKTTQSSFLLYAGAASNSRTTIRSYSNTTKTINTTVEKAAGIGTLNRDDEKLIKIIELPYCPLEAVIRSSSHDAYIDFLYDSVSLDGEYNTVVVNNSITGNSKAIILENDLNIIPDKIATKFDTTYKRDYGTIVERDIGLESKLYSSEFYQPRFSYDSFNYIFNLEDINLNVALQLRDYQYGIIYNVSKNLKSVMSFKFNGDGSPMGTPRGLSHFYTNTSYNNVDYDGIVIADRNNELPIYTDDYINYLKTGYNYDVKNKQTKETASWITTGVGIASTVAGIVLAATGYGSAFGGALIATGVTTTATSLTSAISGQVQAENQFNQKQEELSKRQLGISQCDDVSIMDTYNGNKAYMLTYKVSSDIEGKLFDLFHYFGYKEIKRGIPDMTTRHWFNFCQCEADIEQPDNMTDEVLANIKDKWSVGVTELHDNVGPDSQEHYWDFNQEYENWETSLETII